ncbi:hypothetical protein Tco_0910403 [Tanacetum coccineum]|uniref:Uncharacterized protein n=1 Tax=Tanacetum coccineum TaxID=301880 RepID=A0ABQ5CT45_9ASTR
MNGLYASDGEINLEKNDNLISNDYAVKLCLKYEVRKGKKLVKKELMVLLRGEIYFSQFILNPEENEFEPGLIFGRPFLCYANAMVNFEEGTITIQPDFDPFLLSSDEEKNPNLDDLETLLDFDIEEAPQTETDLSPLVCKMGKGIGIPLTQEETEKRALAHNISMRYEILEEVRPVIETLAYNDKYRKLLDEIWADKVRLDGMVKPKEERVMVKVKGQMLKEKKDPGAFIFPIRTYEQLGRDDIRKEERNITMINYTEAEVAGRLVNVLCQVGFTTLSAKFLILEIPVDQDAPIVVGRGFLDTIGGNIDIPNRIFTTFDRLTRQTFRAAKSEKIRIAESDSDDEEDYVIKRNKMGTPIHNSRPIRYQNNTNPAENMTLSTLESVINPFRKISVWKKAVSFLGSLLAKLRDVEWKTDYKMCYSNPKLETGQWKTEIRLTDPYGNIYMQAFVTKPTKRKLSKTGSASVLVVKPPHLLDYLKTAALTLGAYDHEAGSSHAKRYQNVETVKEALLLDVHYEFLDWRGCSREAKSCYNSRLTTLFPRLIYSPQIMDWQLLHKIGCGDEIDQMLKISLKEAQSEEEILFFVAWVRAFNINEPIYPELCRKFYDTYEFDEVCAGDELQSKKIISFRLGGRAHSLTLLEFARRLGLYHAKELEEDEWVCECGLGNCKMDEKKGSWKPKRQSDLLWTTLRELIDSEDRLIPDIPVDDVQRVAAHRAPRVQRALMHDLYERMGSMEIRQKAIERM